MLHVPIFVILGMVFSRLSFHPNGTNRMSAQRKDPRELSQQLAKLPVSSEEVAPGQETAVHELFSSFRGDV